MNTPIRPALVVAVVFLMTVCIFGLRLACDPAGLWEIFQEDRRREKLQQFERGLSRRVEAKERVVREVIAQGCSLSETLTQLQELDREWLQEADREWPDAAIGVSEDYRRVWTDADYYYWYITWLAAKFLEDRPEEAAAVLRRLEKDYQQLQAGRQTPSTAPTMRTERSR
jgi:hypothetical protein